MNSVLKRKQTASFCCNVFLLVASFDYFILILLFGFICLLNSKVSVQFVCNSFNFIRTFMNDRVWFANKTIHINTHKRMIDKRNGEKGY